MKITFFVSGSIRSNFSYRALALAKVLHALGNQVSIIAPSADKYNDFIPERVEAIDGVSIIQPFQLLTRRPEINLFPYLFGAFDALRKERPDLIYIYKPTPASVVGLLGKLFWKIPIVVDMDDLGSEVMKIEGHPAHQRKLVEWSERMATNYADKLVVASTYLFERYHAVSPGTPIHIMPNGVEAEWFALPAGNTGAGKKRIVFLGSLNRRSILEPLFDVLQDILKERPSTQIVIIGDGKYLEYFKQKSIALHVDHNVVFTGWLALSDVRHYLQAGDIGYNYMPNERTVKAASNMKVPQYMSRGVVPVVSDVGDMPNSVDFGRAGYIAQADNDDHLKATLLYALRDSDIQQKADRARSFSLEKFNWDILGLQFYQWIR